MKSKTHLILILYLLVSTGTVFSAELIIATGELPPIVSEQYDQSFLTEIFRAVGDEMGVTFVFKFMPWKRCELAAERLEVWGIIPYIRTDERDKRFNFSERLYTRQAKFFYYSSDGNEKDIHYTDLKDLKKYNRISI